MSRVNVDRVTKTDTRYRRLGRLLELPGGWHEARSRMIDVWMECTDQDSYYLEADELALSFGDDLQQPDHVIVGALIDARLVEKNRHGLRVKGTRNRVEWLAKKRKAGAKGGKSKGNSAKQNGVSASDPPPKQKGSSASDFGTPSYSGSYSGSGSSLSYERENPPNPPRGAEPAAPNLPSDSEQPGLPGVSVPDPPGEQEPDPFGVTKVKRAKPPKGPPKIRGIDAGRVREVASEFMAAYNPAFGRNLDPEKWLDPVARCLKAGFCSSQLRAALWWAIEEWAEDPDWAPRIMPSTVLKMRAVEGKRALPQYLDLAEELWRKITGEEPTWPPYKRRVGKGAA